MPLIYKKKVNLPSLNINPLSVAKYFYEKGVETSSIMQDLLYLSYLEVLKKEGLFLFAEEFQAWQPGPTLDSVFFTMSKYFQKNATYEGLFDKYPDIDNETITKYLEKIYRQYKEHETKRRVMSFYEKAKDKAWRITRKPLGDSSDYRPIKLRTLTDSYLRK